MSHEPGADELQIRDLLIQRGVGPDADAPVPPPHEQPDEREPDWLDDIIAADPAPAEEETPEPEPEPGAEPEQPVAKQPAKPRPKPRRKKPKKRKKPKPGAARTAWDTQPASPRQSLVEAWDRVPYRLKWLAYHASAAYLGWTTGLVGWATYVTAWIAATGMVGVQAFFWYGVAAAEFLLYQRTRSWWLPAAWLAAVPASSTVVGVLLYGTPHQ